MKPLYPKIKLTFPDIKVLFYKAKRDRTVFWFLIGVLMGWIAKWVCC